MPEKECLNCGSTITRTYESDERWENRKYCDASCQMNHEYESGERDPEETVKEAHNAVKEKGLKSFRKNPKTKDWRGWTKIYIPAAHPDLEQGWMLEHHYVWWKEKGRLPPEDKVIHHKDGDKKNNNIENLELLTPAEHASIHNESQPVPKTCKICGESFETIPSQEDRRITCSRECQVKWQKEYR